MHLHGCLFIPKGFLHEAHLASQLATDLLVVLNHTVNDSLVSSKMKSSLLPAGAVFKFYFSFPKSWILCKYVT